MKIIIVIIIINIIIIIITIIKIINNNIIEMIEKFSIFKDFKRVATEDLTILGAPVLEGRTVDNVLKRKIATLKNQLKGFQHFSLITLSAF